MTRLIHSQNSLAFRHEVDDIFKAHIVRPSSSHYHLSNEYSKMVAEDRGNVDNSQKVINPSVPYTSIVCFLCVVPTISILDMNYDIKLGSYYPSMIISKHRIRII